MRCGVPLAAAARPGRGCGGCGGPRALGRCVGPGAAAALARRVPCFGPAQRRQPPGEGRRVGAGGGRGGEVAARMMTGLVGSPVGAVMQENFGCSVANRFCQLLDDESDPFDVLREAERRQQQRKKRDEAAAVARRAMPGGRAGGGKRETQKERRQPESSPAPSPAAPPQPGTRAAPRRGGGGPERWPVLGRREGGARCGPRGAAWVAAGSALRRPLGSCGVAGVALSWRG